VSIRLAQIGCGYWGRNLARNFSRIGVLTAIADDNPQTAAAQAAQHRVPVRDVDSILADRAIDAVAIATPAMTHGSLAARALDAGKHVFVEKPLALSIDDAEAAIAASKRTHRVLMVGHLLRYHPAFLRLQELIGQGRLGRIQHLYSHRLNLGKLRREENVFWSFAPHDISMILALVGSEPSDVRAVGSSHLQSGIADVTTTHLEFVGGVAAHIFVSWLHPFKEQRLVVVGDGGMAVFDDRQPWSDKLQLFRHAIQWQDGMPEPVRADAESVPLDAAEPLELECRHFVECASTGRSPLTDGYEGLRVLRVLDAAQRSMDLAARRGAPSPSDIFVHPSADVDPGVVIGTGTKIWHFSHILGGSTIGRDCTIGQNVMIGPDVSVADHCKIQNNVSLYKGVTLEKGVFCGPSCVFTNVNTPRAEIERKTDYLETRVERGATIGANATIVCGNSIGAYSLVGAGAVITSDVKPFALMVGNPARRIGWVGHAGERLLADGTSLWRCPRTGRRYQVVNDDLTEIDLLEKAS